MGLGIVAGRLLNTSLRCGDIVAGEVGTDGNNSEHTKHTAYFSTLDQNCNRSYIPNYIEL